MADHLLSARSKGRQETRCQERFPTTSGFCKPLMTAGKGSAIRRGTDLDLPPGQESGLLKGIVFELGNQRHRSQLSCMEPRDGLDR